MNDPRSYVAVLERRGCRIGKARPACGPFTFRCLRVSPDVMRIGIRFHICSPEVPAEIKITNKNQMFKERLAMRTKKVHYGHIAAVRDSFAPAEPL
jgi:hypothetical protein